MNNSEEVSNTFMIHSFIALSALILIYGSFFAITLIKIVGNMVSSGSSDHSMVTIVVGLICLALIPYCFRIIKSLQILEIVGAKVLLHPPIFVNDINLPSEIELKQITCISRDKILNNLVKITFAEEGEQKKIFSFIKKGKLDLLKETMPLIKTA